MSDVSMITNTYKLTLWLKEQVNKNLNLNIKSKTINNILKRYIYLLLNKQNPKHYTYEVINNSYIDGDLNSTCNNLRKIQRKIIKEEEKKDLYDDRISDCKARQIVDSIRANTKNVKINSVLDFGGGNGKILKSIGKILNINKENLYLCDIDEWAGQEWVKNREKNVKFIPSNKLSDTNIKVDLIIASHTLHHIKDNELKDIAKSFNKILNKDGIIVLKEHDIDNNIKRKLVELKHIVYDVIIDLKYTYKQQIKEEISNYKSMNEWNNMFSNFKLLRYERHNKSNDWTYFGFYSKK